MGTSVLTVSQINRYLKMQFDADTRLADVTVTGELSNFSRNGKSGHLYFSLKDSASVLHGMMFSATARGLRFRPADGMKVIVRGRVVVYEPNGQYQLRAETMQPDGVGALALAYEQLKQQLAAEGLFDESRKQPLPPCPQRIGVVTSPTGAVLQDIRRVVGRRWPLAELVFCPCLVQGDAAVPQLIHALEELNRQNACDVIIIGRGGGSMEDLWPFNNESLARTVAWSKIPVVSAVGHETDDTLCDKAADYRASTPSVAAEVCTPDIEEVRAQLRKAQRFFEQNALQYLADLRQRVDLLLDASPLRRPQACIQPRREELRQLAGRLETLAAASLERRRRGLALLSGSLDALSPLKVLARGYGVIYHQGRAVRDLAALPAGSEVTLQAEQGRRQATLL